MDIRDLVLPLTIGALACASAAAQTPPAVAEQVEAMKKLSMMDGEWRGPGKVEAPDGNVYDFIQTERIGTLKSGNVRLIEGTGYGADGSQRFTAFAILAYDSKEDQYLWRSYSGGQINDFPIELTDDGVKWEIPGDGSKTVYDISIADGVWHETGVVVSDDGSEEQFIEFTLQRIGDSSWPLDGAVAFE